MLSSPASNRQREGMIETSLEATEPGSYDATCWTNGSTAIAKIVMTAPIEAMFLLRQLVWDLSQKYALTAEKKTVPPSYRIKHHHASPRTSAGVVVHLNVSKQMWPSLEPLPPGLADGRSHGNHEGWFHYN